MPRLSTRLTMTALVATTLAFAACQRTPDTTDSTTDAAVPNSAAAVAKNGGDDAHPTDVISSVDHASGPEGVDAKALAGQFAGILPCADCPGLDTTLTLEAGGAYQLREAYQERDTAHHSAGTWTAEKDGKVIRLDPDSKGADDRLFERVSNDELLQLDMDGNPPDSALDYSLRRRVAAR